MSYLNELVQPTQKQPIMGKTMVKNNEGGYVFEVNKWDYLKRFLILGTEGGSFYCGQTQMSQDTAKNTIECIKEDGLRVLSILKEINPIKEDTRIFTLALLATYGDLDVKSKTYTSIKEFCYTPTLLFMFCDFVTKMRGWSSGLVRGVKRYYLETSPERLALQIMKYQSRNDWNHADVLNLVHPKPVTPEQDSIFKYIIKQEITESTPKFIEVAHNCLKNKYKESEVIDFIKEYDLPREVIPTEMLKGKNIWKALLVKMPYIALVRNLGNLTKLEVLKSPLQAEVKDVIARITNEEMINKLNINPMFLLVAHATYESGCGFKGSGNWTPVKQILDALEKAYYLSFKYVKPTNKNFLLGIDVSGSMRSPISGKNVSSAQAAATLAMVIARQESNYEIMGFAQEFRNLNISSEDSLSEAMKKTYDNNFGATDCSLPMIYAMKNRLDVDCFIVITDSETYQGNTHPSSALKLYNKSMNKNAKMIVIATESNNISIADPSNPNMLDISGFSDNILQIIQEFVK